MGLRFFNLIKKRSLTFLMWRAKHLIRINAVTLFAILAGGGGGWGGGGEVLQSSGRLRGKKRLEGQ